MRNYTFTRREKVLLVILAVILLVLVWYLLVFKPCSDRISTAQSNVVGIEEKTDTATVKLSRMRYMQSEIDAAKAASGGIPTPLPSYDNAANLIAQLNTILAGVDSYSISFSDPEIGTDGIVRRSVQLSYGCANYDAAKSVLAAIAGCPYRNQIVSFSMGTGSVASSNGTIVGTRGTTSSSSGSSAYSVSTTIVFYEQVTGM